MFHTTTTTPFNHFSGSCGGYLNFAPNQAMHWVPKVSSVLGHTQKCPFVSHHCQQKWSRSPTTPALDLQHDVGAEPVDTCPGGPCWNVFFFSFFFLELWKSVFCVSFCRLFSIFFCVLVLITSTNVILDFGPHFKFNFSDFFPLKNIFN